MRSFICKTVRISMLSYFILLLYRFDIVNIPLCFKANALQWQYLNIRDDYFGQLSNISIKERHQQYATMSNGQRELCETMR